MPTTLVCVDTGTTNTRVWLVEGERILARQEAAVARTARATETIAACAPRFAS